MRRMGTPARLSRTHYGHGIGSRVFDRLRWNFSLQLGGTDETRFDHFSVDGDLVPASNPACGRLYCHHCGFGALRDRTGCNLDLSRDIAPGFGTGNWILVVGVETVIDDSAAGNDQLHILSCPAIL